MAEFSYKAVTREGKLTNGRLEASDSRAVTLRIQGMGLIPISVEQSAAKSQPRRSLFQRIGPRDILFFTEELSTLVHAGLPLDRSLAITAELASKPALRSVVNDVLKQIKEYRPAMMLSELIECGTRPAKRSEPRSPKSEPV